MSVKENALSSLPLEDARVKYFLRIDNLTPKEYKFLLSWIEYANKLTNYKDLAGLSLTEKLIKSHELHNKR